jgi:hypothetical protein
VNSMSGVNISSRILDCAAVRRWYVNSCTFLVLTFVVRMTHGAGQFPIRNLPRHQLLKRVRNEHVIGCFVVLIPIVW